MTFTEAAAEVLRIAGKPLHYKEITELAIEKNLLSHVGKSPEVTMGARLAALLKKEDKANPIVRVKPGVFALREWKEKKGKSAPAQEAQEEGEEVNALEVEAAAAVPPDSSHTVLEDEEGEGSEIALSGEDALRADLAASGAELFDDEDDDDQPILGGPESTPEAASADGTADGGRRRRRRRRRGRGRGEGEGAERTSTPRVEGAAAEGATENAEQSSRPERSERGERGERGEGRRNRGERGERQERPAAEVQALAETTGAESPTAFQDTIPDGMAPEAAGEERQGRRRRRRGGRDREDRAQEAGSEALNGAETEQAADAGAVPAEAPAQEGAAADTQGEAPSDGAQGEEGRDGRRRRSRDRYRRDRREGQAGEGADVADSSEGAEQAAPQQLELVGEAVESVAVAAAAPAAVIEAAAAAPVPAPAAPVVAAAPVEAPAAAVVPAYSLPIGDLHGIAEAAGLQWVNSDADKVAAAQAAIAAEPKPVRVPRERPPVLQLDEGPPSRRTVPPFA